MAASRGCGGFAQVRAEQELMGAPKPQPRSQAELPAAIKQGSPPAGFGYFASLGGSGPGEAAGFEEVT